MSVPYMQPSSAYEQSDLTLDRKLVKQSPVRDTLYIYDDQHQQVSVAESNLEAERILQLMFDPDVAEYKAQKFSCYPYPDAPSRRYTLDNHVVMKTGEVFEEEVKPKSLTTSQAFKEKHAVIAEHARTYRQANHRVITEEDINTGSLTDNLWFLLPRRNSACPFTEAIAFLDATGLQIGTVREAQNLAREHGFDPDLIARCVAHRLLQCDLTVDWPDITLDFTSIR